MPVGYLVYFGLHIGEPARFGKRQGGATTGSEMRAEVWLLQRTSLKTHVVASRVELKLGSTRELCVGYRESAREKKQRTHPRVKWKKLVSVTDMPSYALNQFIDMDDLLCKQLLSLDMGELTKTSVPPSSAVGYKKPCMFTEPRSVTPSTWAQPRETSLPSQWNKMAFWSDRSISMVEGDAGGLGWASDKAATSVASLACSTSSLSSSAASSRYKTELCRTFTERGVCKYGSKCQFAHGHDELRGINRHPKYKTEPCRTFHSIGFCPYGIRCHFVHNSDEDARLRSQQSSVSASAKRPPLLKQSFSFAGFPSTHQPLESALPQSSFLHVPSASTPTSETVSDLLTLAFQDLSPGSTMDQTWDPLPHFLPSPDSGCSQGELTPTVSPSPTVAGVTDQCLSTRSLSLTSLSDHEGCCSSSASSLSGSELSSAPDAAARRLPIFSQLSVPDDGFCSESSASFFL